MRKEEREEYTENLIKELAKGVIEKLKEYKDGDYEKYTEYDVIYSIISDEITEDEETRKDDKNNLTRKWSKKEIRENIENCKRYIIETFYYEKEGEE